MEKMNFIDTMKPMAAEIGNEYNVLPALIMCQAILESNWGTSDLAQNANNFFGIKKGMGWTGPTYTKSTSEWSQEKGWFTIDAAFRKYETPADCFRDLVLKYHTPRYAEVLGEPDLAAAATAAWRAGYATDPNYPGKLLGVFHDNEPQLEGLALAEKVFTIEAGHAGFGITPGKRGPDGKVEWIWNNAVVVGVINYMQKNFKNVRVIRVDDPTGRSDVPLTTRARRANQYGSDLHVSVHHNALGNTWRPYEIGVETFRQIGLSTTTNSGRAQREIHKRIVAAMGLKDRGAKTANLAMTRLTAGPAVLTEGGFMDSRIDRGVMDQLKFMEAQSQAISEGAAVFLKLPRQVQKPAPVPVVKPSVSYRVRTSWQDAESQIGAFADIINAKRLADSRQSDGYKVFDNDGKLVYTPKAPTPAPHPIPVDTEGVDNMNDVAIVVHSKDDVLTAWKMHIRTGWPIFAREALDEDVPRAKKIIAIGGGIGDLENYAEEVVLLSGKNWESTVAATYKFLKTL